MVWLDPDDHESRNYVELRLNAPESEKIYLEFDPLKMSGAPDWDPIWEEWHCYAFPLRIYKQDYESLLCYFNKIYPIQDAWNGTPEPVFDVCFDNWIGKSDWLRLMDEIERDLNGVDSGKRAFLTDFLAWIKNALAHTSIIVVEGNQ